MRGSRHSEELIIAILKQKEAGLATSDLCHQQGIRSKQTYDRWKAKYGGKESGDAVPCSGPHPRCKRTTKLNWKLSFGLV